MRKTQKFQTYWVPLPVVQSMWSDLPNIRPFQTNWRLWRIRNDVCLPSCHPSPWKRFNVLSLKWCNNSINVFILKIFRPKLILVIKIWFDFNTFVVKIQVKFQVNSEILGGEGIHAYVTNCHIGEGTTVVIMSSHTFQFLNISYFFTWSDLMKHHFYKSSTNLK